MADVISFPSGQARTHTKRARLAAYLRELAELVDADEIEIEPTSALVVLTGPRTHEVVCCGYDDDEWGFDEAGRVAGYVTRDCGFATIGQNRRERGDYVSRPLKHSNIVDGAFPRTSHKEPADV